MVPTEAMDKRNEAAIAQLQADEKKPPYTLYVIFGLAAVGVFGGLAILLQGNEGAAVNAALLFAFVTAIVAPLVAKQVQNTHDTVNARLGEERREKEAARKEALRQSEEAKEQKLLEAAELKRQTDANAQLAKDLLAAKDQLLEFSELLGHVKTEAALLKEPPEKIEDALGLVPKNEGS